MKFRRAWCFLFGHAAHDVTPYFKYDDTLFVLVCGRCATEIRCKITTKIVTKPMIR